MASHRKLLTPSWDTCFWHQSPHICPGMYVNIAMPRKPFITIMVIGRSKIFNGMAEMTLYHGIGGVAMVTPSYWCPIFSAYYPVCYGLYGYQSGETSPAATTASHAAALALLSSLWTSWGWMCICWLDPIWTLFRSKRAILPCCAWAGPGACDPISSTLTTMLSVSSIYASDDRTWV